MSRVDHYNAVLQKLAARARSENPGLLCMWWEHQSFQILRKNEWEWWMDWCLHLISAPNPDSDERRHTIRKIKKNKNGELSLSLGRTRRCRGFYTEMT